MHPEIHTTSEPWIMLHPLRALEEGAFSADHDAAYAHIALTDFLDNIENGSTKYYEAVRLFAEHLYDAALAGTGATVFLDKTPRYYMVLDQLAQVFPKAKFILLVRNPAAVLSSVYRTWVRPNLWTVRRMSRDLLDAPRAITSARDSLGSRAYYLRYEDFLSDAEGTTAALFDFLGLDAARGQDGSDLPRFRLGDPVNVYENESARPDFVDRWKKNLSDPQLWRWTHDYLSILGDQTIVDMGYEPAEIRADLAKTRPLARFATVPLRLILSGTTGGE